MEITVTQPVKLSPPEGISKQLVAPLKRWMLLNFYLDNTFFENQPDRQWISNKLLPKLSKIEQGRILFVGCAPYTWNTLKAFHKGAELITVDYDVRNVIWGGHKHIVADIQEIDKFVEPASFDIVLLNGIFGHGVDSFEAQSKTYQALHSIMRPDGLLLVGWNHDLSFDPLELPVCKENFYKSTFEELPERTCFVDCTHVFDFLRRNSW